MGEPIRQAIDTLRAEANGFHQISQRTPGGDRLAERLGDMVDTEAGALERVVSGEIVTAERAALLEMVERWCSHHMRHYRDPERPCVGDEMLKCVPCWARRVLAEIDGTTP